MVDRSRSQKSPRDLKDVLDAERAGTPFLVFRDGEQRQSVVTLQVSERPIIIGRHPSSDLCIGWDPLVSSLHARLECTNGIWFLHDDGFSRNGSFVGNERVHGYRALRDGDELRFGRTSVRYRNPELRSASTAVLETSDIPLFLISPAQRRVLVSLCRPYKDRPSFARPATNQEIADELCLSLEAVKSHLKALYARSGLDGLPQSEKRMRLIEHALQTGVVSEHDL